MKKELEMEAEESKRTVDRRVEILRGKKPDELIVLLGHCEGRIRTDRKLDAESIKKLRDAEMWAKAVSYVLEHPEVSRVTASAEETHRTVGGGGHVTHPKNMTPIEAANYLRIPKSPLYKGTSRGEIPHRKVGRRLLFTQAELDEYLLGKRVMSQEERYRAAETKMAELRKRRKK